jgi:hypothetical protein
MGATTATPGSQALEWVLQKVSDASKNGWYLDKVSSLASSKPAYLNGFTAQPPAPMPAAAPSASGGVSQAELDRVADRAAKAEGIANGLGARVASLEKELALLRSHVEEAVGPDQEGEHKSHWWGRK